MRNIKFYLVTVFLSIFILYQGNAQEQVIKGEIRDSKGDYPLIGVTILLSDTDPILGTTTDVNGKFRLDNVPLGRQTLVIQYVGYKTMSIPNVLVTAGKEVILNLQLEESVEKLKEIVITSKSTKDVPNNELAKVSARTFSLEEVTRFSGGRNDVARLATSFAGVSAPDDSRNDIVVRGNSPTGLLWRIEGIPIASTNHFATLGTSGGPVNALNTNLLRTSDFLTGAFPAEYGNANAAVFDVNFRNGNPDKHEFTAQLAAFSGLEFMAEGPLSKKHEGSYLASYRYGVASLAATGTSATPFFQDFSFKINFAETKIGRFQLFGFGGLSSIDFLGDEIDEDDLFANPNQDAFVENHIGLIGLSHLLRLNKTTYLKSSFGASSNQNLYTQDNLIKNESNETTAKFRATNVENQENRYTFNTVLNKKFNARWSLRAGTTIELYDVIFNTTDRDNRASIPDNNNDNVPDFFNIIRNVDDQYVLGQLFGQAEYKFSDQLSATFGIHSQYLDLTSDVSFEPRAALSWQFKPNQRLSIAYGHHAQVVPAPVFFFEETVSEGISRRTNDDLGYMKSNHFILGYDRNFGGSWRLKAEAYYQDLYDIPVESIASSYSILNEGADFIFEEKNNLVNEGTGFNVGMELTVEKFFSKGYYMLMTSSIYESKYEGSDGIERNTAFNNNVVVNLLFGKEWKFGPGQKNAWTFDTKFTTSGGKPFTPVDLAATRQNAGREIRMDQVAFSERYDPYLRWDIKFGVRINSAKKDISHQFFIDLQNVTNRGNEFVRRYNEVTDDINVVEQIGFFPDVMYRIQF